MVDECYKNKLFYYNLMQDFLNNKNSAWGLRERYLSQRNEDLDQNIITGYSDYYLNRVLFGKEKIFDEEYADLLYRKALKDNWFDILKEYEKGAKELDIKGELFFMGIWNFIDEYIREYHPSDDEGFDPVFNFDEQTLTKIIQAAFDVLVRNKERW